jgi:cyclophilin family peptidyl-prolyl cis-trans isomerase/protein-disulfide isomerase
MKKFLRLAAWLLVPMMTGCLAANPTPITTDAAQITPLVLREFSTPTEAPRCNRVTVDPTPGPDVPSLFPRVSDLDHTSGPADAPVTLIVYTDFQCPVCDEYEALFSRLRQEHPTDLRFVFRPYPQLATYDKSGLAAQAAEAAARQGKFWEMNELLFKRNAEWVDLSPEAFEPWLITEAGALGLDAARFGADLKSDAVLDKVLAAYDFGRKNGLVVPLVLINGQIVNPPFNHYTLDQTVRLIALGERQFKDCPAWVIEAGKQYLATLQTEKGEVVIQLFADLVPNTVNNFVFLARQGWYNNITFHRVIAGSVVQTGDPSGTGLGNPGYLINTEIVPTLKFDRPGMVGMTSPGTDTNGSQFFITLQPNPQLDGQYTLFGQVISGLDVLEKLTARDPQFGEDTPPGDALLSVTIMER